MSLLALAAVGGSLIVAGADLALSKRLRESRLDSLVVTLLTGVVCVRINVAAGLLMGFLAEWTRRLRPSRAGVERRWLLAGGSEGRGSNSGRLDYSKRCSIPPPLFAAHRVLRATGPA